MLACPLGPQSSRAEPPLRVPVPETTPAADAWSVNGPHLADEEAGGGGGDDPGDEPESPRDAHEEARVPVETMSGWVCRKLPFTQPAFFLERRLFGSPVWMQFSSHQEVVLLTPVSVT